MSLELEGGPVPEERIVPTTDTLELSPYKCTIIL